MVRKLLATSLVATALIFSGCGDDEGESRLETQQMLDDGDFKGVIARLETNSTSNINSNDNYLALAAAYMGKGGYTLLDIVGSMIEDEDGNSEEDEDIIASLAENATFSSTLDLEKAEMYYTKVVGENTCNESNLTSSQEDMCLFVGLSAITKAASTVKLLVGDISSFGSDDASEDYKLTATGCAMQFAFDNNMSATSEKCNIVVDKPDVTFTLIGKTYTPLTIDVKSESASNKYYYLMTQQDDITKTRQTTLTSGYCTNDNFSTRTDDYSSSLYACPINENPDTNDTTSIDVLVDALNGGIDSVANIGSDDEDNDMKSSIDEFKCDVLGGDYDNNSCSEDLEKEVEEQAVIDYLNNQNGE